MQQGNKNFFSNILNLVFNIVVGVLYTPYLVRTLGPVAYGVVPLSLVINQYINVFSLSILNALTRFYSVEYRKGDLDKASRYLSTSVIVCVCFAIIVYPLLEVGIQYIDHFFDIPGDLLTDAKHLFRLTILSFFLSIITNSFNSTLFADNYLDYINYLKIVRNVLKFAINVVLFVVVDVSIVCVGIANFITEAIVLLLSVVFYQKKKPQGIHIGLSLFDKASMLSMLGMISWVMLQRFSDTFLYKIDTIIMNIYFGITLTGVIGAVSEFGTYVTSVTLILGSLVGPLLLIAYSKKDDQNYKRLSIEGGYIIGLVSALLCGILCGSAGPLLSLWLGPDYGQYSLWLIIKLVVVPFMTVGGVFSNSYLYANKNKMPAIFSAVISLLNVLLVLFVVELTKSPTVFLVICSVFVILQGLFMNVYFYNKLVLGGISSIISRTLVYTLLMIVTGLVTYGLFRLLSVSNIYMLVVLYAVIGIIGVIVIDTFCLRHREQKELLYELVPLYRTIKQILFHSLN